MARLAPLTLDGALAGRLLPASEVGIALDAAALLEASRAEGERLRAEAARDAQRLREETLRTARAEFEAEAQDRLFAIAEAAVEQLARTEERIIALALTIARRVIGELPEAEVAERIARATLRRAAGSGAVRLRIAPAHAAVLRERLAALTEDGALRLEVTVVEDPQITDAGCILETDAGLLDATMDSQLAAIERHLRGSLGRVRP